MNNREFSDNFDVLLNSYDSKTPFGDEASKQEISLNEYEKSVFLTMAEEDILKSYFDKTLNPQEQGFDDSARRQIDYSSLIKIVDVKPANIKKSTPSSTQEPQRRLATKAATRAGATTYDWRERPYNHTVDQTMYETRYHCSTWYENKVLFDSDGGSAWVAYYKRNGAQIYFDSAPSWLSVTYNHAPLARPIDYFNIVCEPNDTGETRTASVKVVIRQRWTDNNDYYYFVERDIVITQYADHTPHHVLSCYCTVQFPEENFVRRAITLPNDSMNSIAENPEYYEYRDGQKIFILFSDGLSAEDHYNDGHISWELKTDKYYCDTYPGESYMTNNFVVSSPSETIPDLFNVRIEKDGILVYPKANNTSTLRKRACLHIEINNDGDEAEYDILLTMGGTVSEVPSYVSSTKKSQPSAWGYLDMLKFDSLGGYRTSQVYVYPSAYECLGISADAGDIPDWLTVSYDNTDVTDNQLAITVTCAPNTNQTQRVAVIPLMVCGPGLGAYGFNNSIVNDFSIRVVQGGTVQSMDDDPYIKMINSVSPSEIIFSSKYDVQNAANNIVPIHLDLTQFVNNVSITTWGAQWFTVEQVDNSNYNVKLKSSNTTQLDRVEKISFLAYDRWGRMQGLDVRVKQLKNVLIVGPVPELSVSPYNNTNNPITFNSSGGEVIFESVNLPSDTTSTLPSAPYVLWYGGETPEIDLQTYKDWIYVWKDNAGYHISTYPMENSAETKRECIVVFTSNRINGMTSEAATAYVKVVQERQNQVPVISATPDKLGFYGSTPDPIFISVSLTHADDFSIDTTGLNQAFTVEKFGSNSIKVSSVAYSTAAITSSFKIKASNYDYSATPKTIDLGLFASSGDVPSGYYVNPSTPDTEEILFDPGDHLYFPATKTVEKSIFISTKYGGVININTSEFSDVDQVDYTYNSSTGEFKVSFDPNYYWRPISLRVEAEANVDNELPYASKYFYIVQDGYPDITVGNQLSFAGNSTEIKNVECIIRGATKVYVSSSDWIRVVRYDTSLAVSVDDNTGEERHGFIKISAFNTFDEGVESQIEVVQSKAVSIDVDGGGSGSSGGGSSSGGGGSSGGEDTPSYDEQTFVDSSVYDDRSIVYRLPRRVRDNQELDGTTDVLFILQEKLLTKDANDKVIDSYTIKPISYLEYDRIMSRPYAYPMKRQAWRLFQNQPSGFDIFSEIIPPNVAEDVDNTIYRIRYVRRPKPIILEDLPDGLQIDGYTKETTCEINPILHQDILVRAVQLALASKGRQTNSTEKQ